MVSRDGFFSPKHTSSFLSLFFTLTKDRSQVPFIVSIFFNEIKSQFSVNIRILWTENALEFIQKEV